MNQLTLTINSETPPVQLPLDEQGVNIVLREYLNRIGNVLLNTAKYNSNLLKNTHIVGVEIARVRELCDFISVLISIESESI